MTQIITSLHDFPNELRGGAIAVGNFDGVHNGHAVLLSKLVAKARELDGPSLVLTFDPPPVAILVPKRPPSAPLTSIARRAELLDQLNIDALIAYPTDRALVSLSPEEFFQQKIVDSVGARAMVEGPNFHFGKGRAGDTRLLRELCETQGMSLQVVEAQQDASGQMVSSSRIRKCLSEGNVAAANAMLTQTYQIEGIVAKGAQRGRELGFPTANLEDVSSMLPGYGVYAGRVRFGTKTYAAAVHIGPNPTFGDRQAKVEVHVIDWEGAIYGERLKCELLTKIRDVEKFASVEALTAQLHQDVAACRNAASH